MNNNDFNAYLGYRMFNGIFVKIILLPAFALIGLGLLLWCEINGWNAIKSWFGW